MHRAAAAVRAAFALAVHLGHDGAHRHAAQQRLAVLSIGGDDVVLGRERRHGARRHGFLPNVEVQEAADLARAVELGALLLQPPDAQHVGEQPDRKLARERNRARRGRRRGMKLANGNLAHAGLSSVEVSPSGRPSSRALSRRRMILPLRVRGSVPEKAISLGATAAPSRLRAWPRISLFSFSSGRKPAFRETKALTTSPTTGSGLPITPASATAGCSIRALSTSNGPMRWPADLITSSARPTNQ